MVTQNLSNHQIEQFETEGHLFYEHGCADAMIVERFQNEIKTRFPMWNDGEFIPEGAKRDYMECLASVNMGDILYEGCALTRRSYMRMLGTVPKLFSDCPNWLYGRKAICEAKFWDNSFTSLVQNGPWIQWIKQILNSDEIELVSGTLENTYPGFSGSDGRFYATATRFSQSKLKSIVSVIIFISNDDGNATLSILPKSHTHYSDVCKRASYAWRKDEAESLIICSKKGIYEEILPPSCLGKRIDVRGRAGDVLLFQECCFYSVLGNISKSKSHSAVVLHFCNKKEVVFKFDYPKAGSAERNDNGILCKLAVSAQRYRPKRIYQYAKKRVLIPIIRLFKPRPYGLNVGAGPGWRHPTFFSLDICKGADLVHDLTADGHLPVESSSLHAIYSSHCIEHLTENEVINFFKSSYNSLKCGGVIRITCPNMDLYFDAYDKRDLAFFAPYLVKETNRYDSWLRYIVRSFAEPVVDLYSDEYLYKCYQNMGRYEFMDHFINLMNGLDTRHLSQMHRSWWTEQKVVEKLTECGFKDTQASSRYHSIIREMRNPKYFDTNNPVVSLWIEAIKR